MDVLFWVNFLIIWFWCFVCLVSILKLMFNLFNCLVMILSVMVNWLNIIILWFLLSMIGKCLDNYLSLVLLVWEFGLISFGW